MKKYTFNRFLQHSFLEITKLQLNTHSKKVLLIILTSVLIIYTLKSQETCCNALSADFTQIYCFSDVASCVEGVSPCSEVAFEALFPGANIAPGTEQCSPPNTTCQLSGFCDFIYSFLPVELVDFSTKITENGIILRWATASELDNKGFSIEKSTDGKSWAALAFVDGGGTTLEYKEYQFLDKTPTLGANYYRLKQIDFNDSHDYSGIKVSLWRGGIKDLQLVILPNPATQWITPVLPPDIATIGGTVEFEIYDLTGQRIKTINKVAVKEGIRISLEELASGHYILVARQGRQSFSARFAKTEQ